MKRMLLGIPLMIWFHNFNGTSLKNKTSVKVEVIEEVKRVSSVTVNLFFCEVSEVEWCNDSRGGLRECPGYLKRFEGQDS